MAAKWFNSSDSNSKTIGNSKLNDIGPAICQKKYCKKKTKFFDDNKKAFICTRCCKACSESKCDTWVKK